MVPKMASSEPMSDVRVTSSSPSHSASLDMSAMTDTSTGDGRSRAQNYHHQACDACKRRKVRCSGSNPCQHCHRTRSTCIYSSTHGRLTMMERRLRQTEQRLHLVEATWRRFMPTVELEDAIRATENKTELPSGSTTTATSSPEDFKEPSVAAPSQVTTTLRTQPLQKTAKETEDGDENEDENDEDDEDDDEEENELQNQRHGNARALGMDQEWNTAETLEWDETTDCGHTTDGIGSLSASDRASSGYLGPQSGSALLRHLRSVGRFLYDDDGQLQNPQYQRHAAGSVESPEQATWQTDNNDNNDAPPAFLELPAYQAQCVDWYFEHFHQAYPLLHEGYFRAQIAGAVPKPRDGSWPVLSNIVLAVGILAGPSSSSPTSLLASETYARRSLDAFSGGGGGDGRPSLLHRGSLPLVQSLLLLANYSQKRNRVNTGFSLLGIAVNMAVGLGLHREFSSPPPPPPPPGCSSSFTTTTTSSSSPPGVVGRFGTAAAPASTGTGGGGGVSPFHMEIRRRVWWTLYIFDTGARLTFGRPTAWLSGVSVALPRADLGDAQLSVDMECLPPPPPPPNSAIITTPSRAEPEVGGDGKDGRGRGLGVGGTIGGEGSTPTCTSCLVWQSELAAISSRVNAELLRGGAGGRRMLPKRREAWRLNGEIEGWWRRLPAYFTQQQQQQDPSWAWFQVPRMVLLWRARHLHIVLTRPFLLDVLQSRRQLVLPVDGKGRDGLVARCLGAALECTRSINAFCGVMGDQQRPISGALAWYATYWLVTSVFVLAISLVYDPYHASAPEWRAEVDMAQLTLQRLASIEHLADRANRLLLNIMALVPISPSMTLDSTNEPLRMAIADMWSEPWNLQHQSMEDLLGMP